MTTIEQERPQRERTQQPQPDERAAQANRDRARENGNRIVALADIAEENLETADYERLGRSRYEDAFQVLRWLVGADWHERTVDVDRVLHDEHGSLDAGRVGEFIDLILSGRSSLEARNAMRDAQRHAAHAAETRRAAAEARELAGGMHRFADGPLVPSQRPAAPALPAGSSVSSNGAPLPQRREPIAPSQPPMFPPAPPESPAEQTGAMVARHVEAMRNGGMDVKRSQAALASLDQVVPVFEVDQSFSPVSIPQQRDIRDTQRLPMDEVLKHLAQDDAGAEPDDDPEPRPFSGTGLSGDASPARDSEADDDDET